MMVRSALTPIINNKTLNAVGTTIAIATFVSLVKSALRMTPFAAGPEAAWMLVGFGKAWVFDGHGHNIRMSVGDPGEPAQETQDAEAKAFVLALAKEHFGADSTGA